MAHAAPWDVCTVAFAVFPGDTPLNDTICTLVDAANGAGVLVGTLEGADAGGAAAAGPRAGRWTVAR